MFAELQLEIDSLTAKKFSGHVRYGFEHGAITSMMITNRIETISVSNYENLKEDILKIYPDEESFFGNVDLYFDFGRIISVFYTVNLRGEELKSHIRINKKKEVLQCKNVRIVEKK